ncbi:MAG: ribonuclease H-like domain-containing protein [Dehalococcoidia bacterium]
MKAYLDIETSFWGEITIIGVYRADHQFSQLVGEEVTKSNLMKIMEGVETLYTYNGSRFDLPVIERQLGVDLTQHLHSHDLMYDCWRCNLFGGLKRVEEQLGIPRLSKGIDGFEAMYLWDRYKRWQDEEALKTLLLYNKEDVLNLPILESRLLST